MVSSFDFVGRIVKSKNGGYEEKSFQSGWMTRETQFSMVCGNNVQYLNIRGGKWSDDSKNEVRTLSVSQVGEGNPSLTVDWADRMDPDWINRVAHFKRYVVDLSVDEQINKTEFIHQWDFAEYVKDFVSDENNIRNKIYRVKGLIEFNYDAKDDKHYRNFSVSSITLVSSDSEQYCRGSLDLYFQGDCLDTEFATNGKKTFKSYVQYYDRSAKQKYFVPFPLELYDDNANDEPLRTMSKFYSGNDSVMCIGAVVDFINGAQKIADAVAATEDDLSEEERLMVKFGFRTLAEALEEHGKSEAYGDRITEVRYYKPVSGKSNGIMQTSYTSDDLRKRPVFENKTTSTATASKPVSKNTVRETPKFDAQPMDIFASNSVSFDDI